MGDAADFLFNPMPSNIKTKSYICVSVCVLPIYFLKAIGRYAEGMLARYLPVGYTYNTAIHMDMHDSDVIKHWAMHINTQYSHVAHTHLSPYRCGWR